MSIADELRGWANGFAMTRKHYEMQLLAIADRIDEAHKHAIGYVDDRDPETMAENGWYRVMDADEVPVRIGDLMAYADNTKPMEVVALVPPAVFLTEDGPRYADMCRHYHAPTVEDVLDEFANAVLGCDNTEESVQRVIAEYAAKLRLAGDAE